MKLMNNPYATHVDFFQFKGMIASNPKAHPCNIDMMFERKCKFGGILCDFPKKLSETFVFGLSTVAKRSSARCWCKTNSSWRSWRLKI